MYDKVIINGTEYTTDQSALNGAFVAAGSIRYTDTIETSKQASFILKQAYNYENITKFMRVQIFRFNTKIFEGFIWNVSSETNARSGIRELNINCIGNEYIAKKARPVGKAYTSAFFPNIKTIIEDIHSISLVQEGVTIGLVEGADIETGFFTFNYLSPYDCFDLIAERTNMIWYIDENKQLFFVMRGTIFSSLSLTWGARVINYETLRVNRINEKYRNMQYAIGGKIRTSLIEEVQAGDGSKKTYVLPYPLAEIDAVEVDTGSGYVPQSLLIKADSTAGAYWYYQVGSIEIVQGDGLTALSTSSKVRVRFKGLVDAVIISKNEGEILTKKNLDGTSGIICNVEEVDYTELTDIKKFNNDLLDVYAMDSLEVEFETCRSGFKAGMSITGNNIPEEFLTEDLLISEVDCNQEGNVLIYTVKAVYGPLNQSWVDFYTKGKERKNEKIAASALSLEVVTQIYTFEKDWIISDSPNVFQTPLLIPFTTPGVFGFSGLTRNRYLAWYDSLGNEMGRTKVIIENLTPDAVDPSEIFTIAFIPETAEGEIRFIGWIGGQGATSEINTGYVLNMEPVVYNKTNLEIYQIEKTDNKMF